MMTCEESFGDGDDGHLGRLDVAWQTRVGDAPETGQGTAVMTVVTSRLGLSNHHLNRTEEIAHIGALSTHGKPHWYSWESDGE